MKHLSLRPIITDTPVRGESLILVRDVGGKGGWSFTIQDVYEVGYYRDGGALKTFWIWNRREKVWSDFEHESEEDRKSCEICKNRGPKPDDEVLFRSTEEAHAAYWAKAQELAGVFARKQ